MVNWLNVKKILTLNNYSLFLLVFLVILAIIIGFAFLGSNNQQRYNPDGPAPFPSVYPNVPSVPQDPSANVCVTLCTDAQGKNYPCPDVVLRKCENDNECDDCQIEGGRIPATCQIPTKVIAEQQEKLENRSSKYCLPQQEKCLSNTELKSCNLDIDCGICNDDLPEGEQMSCVALKAGQQICPSGEISGESARCKGEATIIKSDGRYCLPKITGCDYRHGTAIWTDKGWRCQCQYPQIYGGEACDVYLACSNYLVDPFSKNKQQLLLNVPGKNNGEIGDIWTRESGINPMGCYNTETNEYVNCPDDIKHPIVYNTFCQCDGVDASTHATYKSSDSSPYQCEIDSCYTNVLGGRYDPSAPKAGSDQPDTTCICSGRGVSLWDYDPQSVIPCNSDEQCKDADNKTCDLKIGTCGGLTGYDWTGRCDDYTIPGSQITLKGNPDTCLYKDIDPNQQKVENGVILPITGLVPGKSPIGQGDICAMDPCMGLFGDPYYIMTSSEARQSIRGNWNPTANNGKGACSCVSPSKDVDLNLIGQKCDHHGNINPVCHTCYDACQPYPGADPCNLQKCGGSCTTLDDHKGSYSCTCTGQCRNVGNVCVHCQPHGTDDCDPNVPCCDPNDACKGRVKIGSGKQFWACLDKNKDTM